MAKEAEQPAVLSLTSPAVSGRRAVAPRLRCADKRLARFLVLCASLGLLLAIQASMACRPLQPVPPLPPPEPWAARDDPVGATDIAFRADKPLLAAVDENSGRVLLWDITSKKKKGSLRAGKGRAMSVAFDRRGKFLAVGSDEGLIEIWDASRLRRISGFPSQRRAVDALAFVCDGKILVSTSVNGVVGFWRVPTGRLLAQRHPHHGPIMALTVSPLGNALVTSTGDGEFQLWVARKQAVRTQMTLPGRRVPDAGPLGDLPFPPPEPALIALDAQGIALQYSPDGKYLCCSGGTDVFVYELARQKLVCRFRPGAPCVTALAYNASGDILAVGDVNGIISMWAMPHGKRLGDFKAHKGPVLALSLNASKNGLISVGRHQQVGQWPLARWERRLTLPHRQSEVRK